jgi:prophage regulatory protein
MTTVMSDPICRYIRPRDLAALLAVHRSTLWRWVHAGHLPRPVHLGPKIVAWDANAIDVWLAARRSAEAEDRNARSC